MLTGLMGDSMIKETLKSLSCNNGWSYGVFWGFDKKNSLLLTLQEVCCEEQMGALIDDMLLQVHMLGQGVIGQSAFTKKHRWMFSDSHFGKLSPSGSIQSSDVLQDDSVFDSHFFNGIKTIAVISVEPLGVVQFGSTQKIAERLEFVSQTRELFQSIEILQGLALSEIEPLVTYSDCWDASGLLPSLNSCQSLNFASPAFRHGDSCADFTEKGCSLDNIPVSFPSASDYDTMGPLVTASSPCENGLRIANTEAHVDPNANKSNISPLQSSTVFELSASQVLYNSKWSKCDIQQSSSSLCNSELFIDVANTSQQLSENRMSNQNCGLFLYSTEDQLQRPSSLCTFEESWPKIDFAKSVPKHCTNDDLFQRFSFMTDNLSGTSEVVTLSSKAHQAPTNIISNFRSSTSVQSSVTSALPSAEKEKGTDAFGKDKRSDCQGVDIGLKIRDDWENVMRPVDTSGHLDVCSSSSGCISEQNLEPKPRISDTLFSKLGLYQRLNEINGGSCSVARSDFRDQLSSTSKRRKIESPLLSSNEGSHLPEFVESVNSFQPVYHLNSTSNFESKDKILRRLEAGSCIGDNCSIIAGNAVSLGKKLEQPAKTIKKKAKPGTKPRPKDRQQIHDRLLELRELIPNGEKMSIDRLLHLTIKNLLFLQSVTRRGIRFAQTDEPKNEMVWKENPNSSNGVTWACEVGDQTMVCPLIVDDLSIPGQMLVEILCEEQGFFLEIVDVIRSFGLTILKGVMEVREAKVWARFTVEAEDDQHVTRHEIFSSLVQLLQLTGPTSVRKSGHLDNVMDGGATFFKSCQQSALRLPISLAQIDA